MEARSVAANNASASVRVPHQATTITTVTARNSAVNSTVVLQSRRSILDQPASCASCGPQAVALDRFAAGLESQPLFLARRGLYDLTDAPALPARAGRYPWMSVSRAGRR